MKHFYAKMYRVQHALQIIDLELKVISKVIKTECEANCRAKIALYEDA